jgi:hypothetical protein
VQWTGRMTAYLFAAAIAAAPGHLTLTTDRVVAFKDGHGLFVKIAEGKADDRGVVFTEQVPDDAVLGSFWALSADDKILAMKAEWDEHKERRSVEGPALSTLDLLRANPGKTVTLVVQDEKEKETWSGTLVEVLESLPEMTPADAEVTATNMPAPVFTRTTTLRGMTETLSEPAARGGSLVVLDTADKGRVVLPIAQIRTVQGKDLKTRVTRVEEVETKSKRLSFDLGPSAAGKSVKLRVFYFTPGIRWIPTYRVTGSLEEKADIALQAEVLDEEEDIDGAALDLVVGVPNFRFDQTISPLSLEPVLRSALAQAAPQLMGQQSMLSNAMFRTRASEMNAADSGEGEAPSMPAELTAGGEQDLYVYGVKSFSLKKGGRATLPLWQSTAAVRHLYTWDLSVTRNAQDSRYASNEYVPTGVRSPLELATNPVWHQLELSNPGAMPWTTGAAFVSAGTLPLAQELLTYTPAGGKTMLPLTIATDVRGEYDEEEIDRRPNARKWNGNTWSEVRKKGTVTVKNWRKETVTVRVRVALGGRAEGASDGGTVKLDEFRASDWQGSSDAGLNNHSDVAWEITLKPGETKRLGYQASFYSR